MLRSDGIVDLNQGRGGLESFFVVCALRKEGHTHGCSRLLVNDGIATFDVFEFNQARFSLYFDVLVRVRRGCESIRKLRWITTRGADDSVAQELTYSVSSVYVAVFAFGLHYRSVNSARKTPGAGFFLFEGIRPNIFHEC